MDYETPIYKILSSKLRESHYHLHEAFEALLHCIDTSRALGDVQGVSEDHRDYHIKAAVELSTILLGIGEVERELTRRGIDIPSSDD